MVNQRGKRDRADDQRTVTISIDKQLVARIDELADLDKRSRSNWIVNALGKIVAEKERLRKVSSASPVSYAKGEGSSQSILHGINEPEG